ncbi:RNA methyltransferase [Parasphingorhabdus sp.]|uniref:RNA methyltransferase n=1 Tax=Parasphingorhabdus sp. TaxID=2709688 RepID=UPI0032653E50
MIKQPAIILVNPQLGENIGKAARAMLNFGLTEMRIVNPRDGWPNPAAGPTASGADQILEHAQVFDTTAEAVADCSHVYATTVRKRGMTKEVLTPWEAADDISGASGKCAILFGPERSGLEVVDVELARKIITVPINPEFGSLNLAQAVILVAYEISKLDSAANVQPTLEKKKAEPAPQKELDMFYEHLERALEKNGYFYPPERAAATKVTLRNMLTKPAWTNEEVKTWRGVVSSLERPPRKDKAKK